MIAICCDIAEEGGRRSGEKRRKRKKKKKMITEWEKMVHAVNRASYSYSTQEKRYS